MKNVTRKSKVANMDAGGPSEIVRQENVTRILDAAERLFKYYGYTKTNVADIARELGMSPANIYRFFASKADIHQALAHRMLDAGYQLAAAILRKPGDASERLREHILKQYDLTLETMIGEQKVHEMVIVAIEQQWPVIDAHIRRLRSLVTEVVREGMESGEFAPGDAEVAADCFMSATATLCHPQLVATCVSDVKVCTPQQVIEFALRGLK